MTDEMREIAERAGAELLLNVGQHEVDLNLVLILDRLVASNLAHVGAIEGHHGLAEVRYADVLVLNACKQAGGPLFKLLN